MESLVPLVTLMFVAIKYWKEKYIFEGQGESVIAYRYKHLCPKRAQSPRELLSKEQSRSHNLKGLTCA